MNENIIDEARNLIANYIVTRRKELGMTQEQLAEKCDLGIATIRRIELAKFIPDGKSLLKLCYGLDCYFFIEPKESDSEIAESFRNRWSRPNSDN